MPSSPEYDNDYIMGCSPINCSEFFARFLQLNEILCVLVRYKFHRFDKAFKAMDRKMTGRFHRGQFNDLLQQ